VYKDNIGNGLVLGGVDSEALSSAPLDSGRI